MTSALATEIDPGMPRSQPLRDALQAISPERAAATTRLFAAGDRLIREAGESRIELRADVAQQPPHAATVELTHAHGRNSLILTAERGSGMIGDRSWHDFDGDARLFAWTLAYESLIGQLSALLGAPLLPVDLKSAPHPSSAIWHWIEFDFHRKDGDDCRGLLGLDKASMETLASASGWIRGGSERGLHIDRDELPLPCRLFLPALDLSTLALRRLRRDDVILLGQRTSIGSALRLRADSGTAAIDAHYAWIAATVSEGICISRALSPGDLRNDAMTTQDISTATDDPDAVDAADPRDTIAVRVEFILDTLSLTLAELDRISAGQILALRQPLDNASVSLRANGKVFGSGQLVSLGASLGVKVTQIGDDLGLQ